MTYSFVLRFVSLLQSTTLAWGVGRGVQGCATGQFMIFILFALIKHIILQESVLNSVHFLCPKQCNKIEGFVLFRIRLSKLWQPKLYPNIGQVPTCLLHPVGTMGTSGFSCMWQLSALEML